MWAGESECFFLPPIRLIFEWIENPKKLEALIIVDIQNDFLAGGSLAVPRGNEVIPVINAIQNEFDLIVSVFISKKTVSWLEFEINLKVESKSEYSKYRLSNFFRNVPSER